MNGVLEKILRSKEKEIEARKMSAPPLELLLMALDRPAARSLSESLRSSSTVGIVTELKKASPSAGILRKNFDPVSLARAYEKNGAAAISVLTDESFFKGKLEHLAVVRAKVALPLLRKDFIIDPYQAVEARAFGADAILLIVAALPKARCRELLVVSKEFGLECLVEVHNSAELQTALSLGVDFIGINNRDLKTFRVDLATTENLMASVPKDVIVVSESGIKSRDDIERLSEFGVDAVLIGETFMRCPDVGAKVKEFVGVKKWLR